MGSCNDIAKTGCVPGLDNTPLECTELISTDCSVSSSAFNFFGIGIGDTLTLILQKISDKVKSISNSLSLLTGRVDVIEASYLKYDALPTYADDTAAGVGGLTTGAPYKDTLGYLRIKL